MWRHCCCKARMDFLEWWWLIFVRTPSFSHLCSSLAEPPSPLPIYVQFSRPPFAHLCTAGNWLKMQKWSAHWEFGFQHCNIFQVPLKPILKVISQECLEVKESYNNKYPQFTGNDFASKPQKEKLQVQIRDIPHGLFLSPFFSTNLVAVS